MTLMVRTLTGFEPAPAHLSNVLSTGDKIIVGGEDWRYSHPVLGSHVGKDATIVSGVSGIGSAFVLVHLDAHPSIQFSMRRQDILQLTQ